MNQIHVEALDTFPDLGRTFSQMKLQDKLDAVSDDTILGLAVRSARMNKQPLEVIASNLMSAYYDNPKAVADIIGQETIDLIKRIYYPA